MVFYWNNKIENLITRNCKDTKNLATMTHIMIKIFQKSATKVILCRTISRYSDDDFSKNREPTDSPLLMTIVGSPIKSDRKRPRKCHRNVPENVPENRIGNVK